MKRFAMIVGLGLCFAAPQWLAAQNHGTVGAYGDYFRFAPNGTPATNYLGVGGRLSIHVAPAVALEGEINYDFAKDITESSTGTGTASTSTTLAKTSVRPLTGLFGPKLQLGTGAFRLFATGKLGFIDFSTTGNSNVVSGGTFSGAVNGVGGGGTHLAFYPGGGFEGFFGPIGIRAEAGDEIYLNNGVYNNLRVTFGPEIRF